MNNRQLLAEIARHYDGDKAAAERALHAVTASLTRALGSEDKVVVRGFGTFVRRRVKARWVRNPRTGDQILAEETAVVRLRPGVVLKAIVAGRREAPPAPVNAKPKKNGKKKN